MAKRHPFFLPKPRTYAESRWVPPVDIYRGRKGWLVKCDLAGIRPQDIETTVEGRRLTIAGVRRDWSIIEGQQTYSMEICYDRFERTVEMPCDLEEAEIDVDYRDGMLLISIACGEGEY